MAGERPALERPPRLSGRLEGEPARVVRVGEASWEPGGDVIHYQNGNNRDDIPVRFTVTMLGEPGKPMSHQAYGPWVGVRHQWRSNH